jgi:16S rRNA (guanine527-N7)-methyltransferase
VPDGIARRSYPQLDGGLASRPSFPEHAYDPIASCTLFPRFEIFSRPATIATRLIATAMDTSRIAELLQPFLGTADDQRLTTNDLQHISTYIDLLLRWNARINLTAIREPEEIVTRHFGESLFAARYLFPARPSVAADAPARPDEQSSAPIRLIDVGSGAGFPGLPIKIWGPDIDLTLIESNQKKATFLREISRQLTLTGINVFAGRAEDFPDSSADVVTLRAVERFDAALAVAAGLVSPGGRLALLISQAQLTQAKSLTPDFAWSPDIPVPNSMSRILVVGVRNQE